MRQWERRIEPLMGGPDLKSGLDRAGLPPQLGC